MAKNPARGQNINPKNTIPNLVGMTRTTAQALLSSLGFTYSESSTNTGDAGQNGIISSQGVTAGNTELLGINVPYVYQTFSFAPFGFTPFGAFGFTPFGAFGFTPVAFSFSTFGFTPFGAFGFLQFGFSPSQCIDENTLVKTPKGDIAVKDLSIGDIVYSVNFNEINESNSLILNSQTLTIDKLIETEINNIEISEKDTVICFNNAYSSKFSQEQPMFIKRDGDYSVIPAGLVDTGDFLIKLNIDGIIVEELIEKVENLTGSFNVYSLALNSQSSYVAGGVLVHTK
jgi:hypothetical protein